MGSLLDLLLRALITHRRAETQAKWMCKGDDLPIDEWIRLGRPRSALAWPF